MRPSDGWESDPGTEWATDAEGDAAQAPPTVWTPQPARPRYEPVASSSRRSTYVPARSTPTLPAMPALLPDDSDGARVAESALRTVGAADAGDAYKQAAGQAVRVTVVAAVTVATGALAWGAGALWLGWQWRALPLALLAAASFTALYMLISEGVGRRYSAAGVELSKIRAARDIHRDRLESRERMHAQAAQSWERTLSKYLDKWEGPE